MSNEIQIDSIDEYFWDRYNPEYKNQIYTAQSQEGFVFFLDDNNYSIENGELNLKSRMAGAWHAIYKAAWKFKPKSVFECGCGGCYHLKNIHKLLPDAEIYGCDLLPDQIDFGIQFSNLPISIIKNIKVSLTSQ